MSDFDDESQSLLSEQDYLLHNTATTSRLLTGIDNMLRKVIYFKATHIKDDPFRFETNLKY
jgi:hypothetical protein